MTTQPTENLEALIDAAVDGQIDPAQIEQLREIMRRDPEARRQYLRAMNIHSALHQRLRFNDMTEAPTPQRAPSVLWRIGLALGSCAALLMLGTAIGFWWTGPASNELNPPIAQAPSIVPVAVVNEGSRGLRIERNGVKYMATTGTPLFEGDRLSTTESTGASVRFIDDQTLIVLSDKTVAQFQLTDAGKRIDLKSGRLLCDVAQQPDGKPMVVSTRFAETVVLGTQFSVRAESDRTRVDVKKGLVRVKDKRTEKTVEAAAGYSSSIDQNNITLEKRSLADVRIKSFTLFDTDTQKPIAAYDPMPQGAIIDLAKLPSRNLNIRANVDRSRMGAVLFGLQGVSHQGRPLKPQRKRQQNYLSRSGEWTYPFMLAGDDDAHSPPRLFPWTPLPGRYTMTATAYANREFHDEIGPTLKFQFTVIDSAAKTKPN